MPHLQHRAATLISSPKHLLNLRVYYAQSAACRARELPRASSPTQWHTHHRKFTYYHPSQQEIRPPFQLERDSRLYKPPRLRLHSAAAAPVAAAPVVAAAAAVTVMALTSLRVRGTPFHKPPRPPPALSSPGLARRHGPSLPSPRNPATFSAGDFGGLTIVQAASASASTLISGPRVPTPPRLRAQPRRAP
jgi:hypothetical protein